MNFVAGFLLGWMDEERAFWTLCNLVEDLLPAYFSKGEPTAITITVIVVVVVLTAPLFMRLSQT
jgi:hypothetical protein